MTTLNIHALKRLEEKINERLAKIKDDAFDSTEFSQFTRYAGLRQGLNLALSLCEEVEKELNS
jgi:hypothetical protein